MLKVKDLLVDYGGFVFIILGIILLLVAGWRIFLGLMYGDMFKFEAIMCLLGLLFGGLFVYFGWSGISKLGELGDKIIEDNIRLDEEEEEEDEDLPWYLQDDPDLDSVVPSGQDEDDASMDGDEESSEPEDSYKQPVFVTWE